MRPLLEFISLSGSSSAVERELPKLDVAGSIPVSRSIRLRARTNLARAMAMPAEALAEAGNGAHSRRSCSPKRRSREGGPLHQRINSRARSRADACPDARVHQRPGNTRWVAWLLERVAQPANESTQRDSADDGPDDGPVLHRVAIPLSCRCGRRRCHAVSDGSFADDEARRRRRVAIVLRRGGDRRKDEADRDDYRANSHAR